MILQTLSEYHHDQLARSNPNYAPDGMELKRIHYVLVLSCDGALVDVEQPEGKLCVAKSLERVGKDAPMIANRMWDSVGYVIGYGSDPKQQKAAVSQNRTFVNLVSAIHRQFPDNLSFAAVNSFYTNHTDQLLAHPLWEQIVSKQGHNLSFRLEGDELLASQQKQVLTYGNVVKPGRCIVSGDQTSVAHTHPKLYLTGCSPTGAKLVSFTKASGYDSFYKKGGDNAPVSVSMAESYTSALTGLLQHNSDNQIVINNVTLVFYTLPDSDFNKLFLCLFGVSNHMTRYDVLQNLRDNMSKYGDSEFVLLALVPNAARVSVRLYIRTTVAAVAANILKFYDQISLEHYDQLKDAMPLITPLFVTAPNENIKRQPPQFVVDYIESVVSGNRISALFQHELLCRVRGRSTRIFSLCAMLKCHLIRNIKIDISMSLETDNRNIGYLLGRLLAISERAQELSNPNLNFTIRDMFYSTMSATPSSVFTRLISSTSVFIRRIPTLGSTIFIKSQFGEVMELLDGNGVPMRLSLDQQSLFAIGYFHQRQTYFKKRDNNEQDS